MKDSNSVSNPKLARVLDLMRELEERKALYVELDRLILELKAEGFTRGIINDMVLLLKDNFADSNTGWTRSAVKRWEIEVISPELEAKRLKRGAK